MDEDSRRGLSSLFGSSDEQTMWRVRTRDDHGAFSALVRRWEGPIRRLCARMIGDPQRAEDLTQETFARLFARRRQYEPVGRFSTFLWRIALNLCYDELRLLKRRAECPLEHDDGESRAGMASAASEASPAAAAMENERAGLVREALVRLPDHYRAVVVLRHYEQLKFRQIAEVLDVPVGTVKSRMAEALSRLARQLRVALGEGPANDQESRERVELTERPES
ncbi:MAG: RNA polymerase sigma factor [Planctomycetota bacterium]|jgi:RNA polymerase sigma-70 factor (ECF subfamily)